MPAHVHALMCDQDGYTALMRAAGARSAECVAAILAVDGIDVNVQAQVRHGVDNNMCYASAHCVRVRPREVLWHAPSQCC